MLLSTDYNKLAWGIRKKYHIPLKWAMKTAYCLRNIPIENPTRWLTKPSSPLSRTWDPANVMKIICVLRSQADQAVDIKRGYALNKAATDLYDRYRSLEGLGCEYVSTLLEGELVYWAAKYYVTSFISKKRNPEKEANSLAIEFSEGNSYTSYWFDYFDS